LACARHFTTSIRLRLRLLQIFYGAKMHQMGRPMLRPAGRSGVWQKPIDSQPFRSLPGQFAPRSESANKTLANSLPGTFAPWPFRSLPHSLPGPLAPWNLRSQKRIGPGTFVPLVDDVDTRYSNYTLLLMRTFSIERCGAHGLSQTLIRRPCNG